MLRLRSRLALRLFGLTVFAITTLSSLGASMPWAY